MQHTTLGFHTFMISKNLAYKHAEGLLNDFKKYKKRTGNLRIRPDYEKSKNDPYGTHLIIEYPDQNKGLSWSMRICRSSHKEKPCSIKAIINPKLFIGIRDYLAAANSDVLSEVENFFNNEAKMISRHLAAIEDYLLVRSDYCINIDLKEMCIPCSAEQLMALIKRGDVPLYYSEWTKYDEKLHRQMPCEFSFYLQSKSTVVNCYQKHQQMLSQFYDCPDLEASRHVLRFEIQFRYAKMYSISKLTRDKTGLSDFDLIQELLSDGFCANVIRSYFNRVIRMGDYFTLDGARFMVEHHNFKRKKEERLIAALELVNESRGIANAKEKLQDNELDAFRRSLRELDKIGVNAVTIPRKWKIKHIPNLLRAYETKRSMELTEERIESEWEMRHEKLIAELLM